MWAGLSVEGVDVMSWRLKQAMLAHERKHDRKIAVVVPSRNTVPRGSWSRSGPRRRGRRMRDA
jgi:hypothetical protein